jgi:hypothetical protein
MPSTCDHDVQTSSIAYVLNVAVDRYSSEVQNNNNMNFAMILYPQSFLDALDDINNNNLVDMDIALNSPPEGE